MMIIFRVDSSNNIGGGHLTRCINIANQLKKRKVNSRNSKANGESNGRKGIDAYKCEKCGLWSTGDKCNNKECI